MTGSSQRCPPFLRALLLYGITKQARKHRIPILIFFKNQIPQYTIYLLDCVLNYYFIFLLFIVPLQMVYPFWPLDFFAFSLNIHFHFYISKDLTVWREVSVFTLE